MTRLKYGHLFHEGERGVWGIDCEREPSPPKGQSFEKTWDECQKVLTSVPSFACRYCAAVVDTPQSVDQAMTLPPVA